MRVLSIDYGTVRVGLAMSDELAMLASPHSVLAYSRSVAEEIASLIEREGVATVVIGIPFALDGSETVMTRQVKNFARKLRGLTAVPLVEWDESFSSKHAGEQMRAAGVKRKKRGEKGKTDAWAAAIILQEYLDGMRNQ